MNNKLSCLVHAESSLHMMIYVIYDCIIVMRTLFEPVAMKSSFTMTSTSANKLCWLCALKIDKVETKLSCF